MDEKTAHTLVENLIRAVQQDERKGTGWASERAALITALTAPDPAWDAICGGCGGTRRQHWGHAMCGMFTPAKPCPQFVVRLWDFHDGWCDVTGPVSEAEAQAVWNERTGNGTHHTKYADGDYYAVFPADTQMVITPEFLGR